MNTHRVSCRACSRVFDGFGETQAHGCAATFKRGVVYGHYGSMHDAVATHVPFADAATDMMDPVCDACIDAWIARGGSEVTEWMDFEHGPLHTWEQAWMRRIKN